MDGQTDSFQTFPPLWLAIFPENFPISFVITVLSMILNHIRCLNITQLTKLLVSLLGSQIASNNLLF